MNYTDGQEIRLGGRVGLGARRWSSCRGGRLRGAEQLFDGNAEGLGELNLRDVLRLAQLRHARAELPSLLSNEFVVMNRVGVRHFFADADKDVAVQPVVPPLRGFEFRRYAEVV